MGTKKNLFFIGCIIVMVVLCTPCLFADVTPYTLNGVEGFFVPRPDFEKFMSAPYEAEYWKKAFDDLNIAYKAEQDNNRFWRDVGPWLGVASFVGGAVAGLFAPRN